MWWGCWIFRGTFELMCLSRSFKVVAFRLEDPWLGSEQIQFCVSVALSWSKLKFQQRGKQANFLGLVEYMECEYFPIKKPKKIFFLKANNKIMCVQICVYVLVCRLSTNVHMCNKIAYNIYTVRRNAVFSIQIFIYLFFIFFFGRIFFIRKHLVN